MKAMSSAPERTRAQKMRDAENGFNSAVEKRLVKINTNVSEAFARAQKGTSIDRADDQYLAEGVDDFKADLRNRMDNWRIDIASTRKSLQDPNVPVGEISERLRNRRSVLAKEIILGLIRNWYGVPVAEGEVSRSIFTSLGDESLLRGMAAHAEVFKHESTIRHAKIEIEVMGKAFGKQVEKTTDSQARLDAFMQELGPLLDADFKVTAGSLTLGNVLSIQSKFDELRAAVAEGLKYAGRFKKRTELAGKRALEASDLYAEAVKQKAFHFDEFVQWAEAG